MTLTQLRESQYTGLSYSTGRTSLPWTVWVVGRIALWTADVREAWERLQQEVADDGGQIESERGSFVFTA